jgi:hypothetical protein
MHQQSIEKIHIPETKNTAHSNEEFATVTFVKNFIIDKGQRHLGGRYFVIDTEETSFFHFLFYHVGQFLLIKKMFPDVRPLVAVTGEVMPPYIDKMMTIINRDHDPEYFNVRDNHDGLFLEEIVFITNRLTPLISKISASKEDLIGETIYSKAISKILRSFMHENVYQMPSEKIYISRRDVSDRTRKYRLLLDAMPKLGIAWDSQERTFFDSYGIYPLLLPTFAPLDIMPWHLEPEARFRYLSEREEEYLENFFVDRGYRILDAGGEDLFQTLSSVFYSTHCAALAGSIAFNLLAASDDTIVFLVNNDTRFEFDYDTAIDASSDSVFHIFDRRVPDGDRKRHDIDDIINAIIETGKV